MRIVYLAYEIRSREIIGYQEIAHYLVESNSADFVFIGDKFILQRLALGRLLIKGFYLLKSAPKRIKNKLKKLKKFGYLLFVHDAESALVYENNGFHYTHMKDQESLKYVKTIFTSSDNEHKTVKDLNPRLRVKQSGFIRFNHLLEKDLFTSIYQKECNKLKKKYGEHILIITSNTAKKFSNHLIQKKLRDEKSYINFFKKHDNLDDWLIKKEIDNANYSHLNLFGLLEFVRLQISSGKSKYKIVWRPHPSEDIAIYERLLHGLDKVNVENNCSLPASILAASKVILSSNSTTSFESALLEKESFCLMPDSKIYLNNHIKEHISNDLSTISKTPDDLFKKINSIENKNNALIEERKSRVKKFINLNSKSMDVFCNEISQVLNHKKGINSRDLLKIKLQKIILYSAQKLYKLFLKNDYFKNTKYGIVSESLKGDITIDEKILKTKFPNAKQEMIDDYILVSKKISPNLNNNFNQ